MKKFTIMLVLLFVLSASAFAEGQYPLGGRTSSQGQVCLTEGDIPLGGKSCPQGQTGLTEDTTHSGGKSHNPIIKTVFDFLESIFG